MRTFFFAILLFTLSACQTLPNKSDREYHDLLVGTWSGKYPEEGGVVLIGEKTYSSDGTARGFTAYKARNESGEFQEVGRIEYTSKWEIQDGVVVITDIISSDGEPSTTIRDKIISIDRKKAVFRDLLDDSEFERQRVK